MEIGRKLIWTQPACWRIAGASSRLQKDNAMTTSDELIRAARERFNLAIEYKDAEAIRAFLAPSYHLVTGRSDQFHGAEAEATRWAEVFRTDPSAVYRRTPREIIVNEAWGLAEELGNWQGSYTAEGMLVQASGVYSAKWQRTENGEWVLQAEVFTTLTCDGPCQPPDPL
jgi:ketosteroid isomerase-like protein